MYNIITYYVILKKEVCMQKGVQSVNIAMILLKAFNTIGHHASLKELSTITNLHPAKVHRYLVSFIESGFVEKTKHGTYTLGHYVLEFSTAYLSRLDPITTASQMIDELRTQTHEGLILSVWGNSGVTVIRWYQARHPISVSISLGSNMNTLMSASGRIFMSHLPRNQTAQIIERELVEASDNTDPRAVKNLNDVDNIINEARTNGITAVEGHAVEWVSALAAPIFDYRGEIVLCLTMFGIKSNFDVDLNGINANLLRDTTKEISKQLGYLSAVP